MRNDFEFKTEILRRKDACLKRRRTRVFAWGSGAATLVLCVAIILSFPGIREESVSNGSPEGEASDVMVSIYLSDRTLTDWEDVGPRLEALGKYVPLPEGDDVIEDSVDSAEGSAESKDSVSRPSAEPDSVATDNSLSTGLPFDPEKVPVATFTVFAGKESKTYYLRKNAIVVDRQVYPLTPAEVEELLSLFGSEEMK